MAITLRNEQGMQISEFEALVRRTRDRLIQQDATTAGILSSTGIAQDMWATVVQTFLPSNFVYRGLLERTPPGQFSAGTLSAKVKQFIRQATGFPRVSNATPVDQGGPLTDLDEYDVILPYKKLAGHIRVMWDAEVLAQTLQVSLRAIHQLWSYTDLLQTEAYLQLHGQPFNMLPANNATPPAPTGVAADYTAASPGPVGGNVYSDDSVDVGTGSLAAATYYIKLACMPGTGFPFGDPGQLASSLSLANRTTKASTASAGIVVGAQNNAINYVSKCTTAGCCGHAIYITDGTTNGQANTQYTWAQTDYGMCGTIYNLPGNAGRNDVTTGYANHVGIVQPPAADTSGDVLEFVGLTTSDACWYDPGSGPMVPFGVAPSGATPRLSGATLINLGGAGLTFRGFRIREFDRPLARIWKQRGVVPQYATMGPLTHQYLNWGLYESGNTRQSFTPSDGDSMAKAGIAYDAYRHPTANTEIDFVIDPQKAEGIVEFVTMDAPANSMGVTRTQQILLLQEVRTKETPAPVTATPGGGDRYEAEQDVRECYGNLYPQGNIQVRGIDFRM